MATRNAESVLPLPVGAEMSVGLPARMEGQPSICGSVGDPNLAMNHSRTAGCALARASDAFALIGISSAGPIWILYWPVRWMFALGGAARMALLRGGRVASL